MTSSIPNKARVTCAHCLRPQTTCICQWITPTANAVDVLILQHPLEVGHAKGSGLLLQQSLQYSTTVEGEAFDAETLHDLLFRPLPHAPDERARPALLYPADQNSQSEHIPTQQEAPPNRLVILDGTWRKSRKMLHVNPLLQKLPRLALTDVEPSRYRIRKAQREDQLSTLEATCQALMQMESDKNKYLPMLNAFDGFVTQQQSYVDTYAAASRSHSRPG